MNYFKEVPDKCWERDVDFTPACCIGQSSALCLEIPNWRQLPNLRDCFVYYKEDEGQFSLQQGSPFSSSSDLVPTVVPSQGINLPYKILFKVNSLVQHGCLPAKALDLKFFRLVDPSRIQLEYIESALEKLHHLKDCCYNPLRWLKKQYIKYNRSGQIPKLRTITLDDGLVYVHRVQVTPTKVYFCGPEINLSNRVLRNYHEDINNFLRVSFVDEDLDKLSSTDLSAHGSSENGKRRTRLYDRILSTLRNGILIGDKKFEFLAFSSSQLREGSAWMFASRDGLTAADIRKWMGDFRCIKNVAKYAARLGQSFGSSHETFRVGRHEVELIPDIQVERDGKNYCFSDGIGKISEDFAREVAKKCGLNRFTPSAFQIRYGGYKGVVAVDPTSSMKLSLRKSMCKYESKNNKLDVLAWSKYQPCFLNRQLITLLSTLGVSDHVFEKKQKETVNRLESILTDSLRAQDELKMMFPGEITNTLKEMLMCGYEPNEEPFLAMMLQTLRASKLLELRTKTRIHVPNGRAMMGCLDETGTLEYGQVFVQCSRPQLFDNSSLVFNISSSSPDTFVVKGKTVVAKNPCLHPGDVRVLKAMDVPELHHMVDCVVFPQKGKMPHTDECSGSDLDGDTYFVCWDQELIPRRRADAMDYTSAKTIEVDHEVTMEEIMEYFADYLVDDNLGIISNAHTVFADKEPKKARSKECIELAKLSSIAVDYPKTGVAAIIPGHLRAKEYPDFMEKTDGFGVWGLGFEGLQFTVQGSGFWVKGAGLRAQGSGFGVQCSVFAAMSSKSRVKALIKEARTWFNNQGDEAANGGDDAYAKKASAWYHVTYHPHYWGRYNKDMGRDHFLSFAWSVYDRLVMIKRDNASMKRSLRISSLVKEFNSGHYFSSEV
ncbi:RNA-dependent RNA polymerase 1 [Morus notabilis]|uniref:RNA-dependent RNA polymerase n=1 Tax=Morus notabilis TaxID=981085 RepID=W9RFM2_9ROSA|nr:RNA-dependent RNA polymerase 1 [Morus notabilis]